MSAFDISYILMWILICVLLVGMAGLYSAFGAGVGELAPVIPPLPASQGPEDGAFVDVPPVTDSLERVISRGRRWLFVEVNCPACESVKDNLEELETEAESLTTVLVCGGKASQALKWLAEVPNWVSVVTDEDKELFELFGVKKPPYFVGLNEQGLCVSKGVISVDLDARASLRRYRDSLSGPRPPAAV